MKVRCGEAEVCPADTVSITGQIMAAAVNDLKRIVRDAKRGKLAVHCPIGRQQAIGGADRDVNRLTFLLSRF
jgi:hypothetical protein